MSVRRRDYGLARVGSNGWATGSEEWLISGRSAGWGVWWVVDYPTSDASEYTKGMLSISGNNDRSWSYDIVDGDSAWLVLGSMWEYG